MGVLLLEQEIKAVWDNCGDGLTWGEYAQALDKAQLKKVVEYIEKHSAVEQLPYRDGGVSIRTIPESSWQVLLKEID